VIINIRGTSGTGKSTLVREVMRRYEDKSVVTQTGRKRPVGYLLRRQAGYPGSQPAGLFVAGHYETACGGCDTLPSYEVVDKLVREYHGQGHHVLFEGLLLSGDAKWCGAMHRDGLPLLVVALDVPIAICVASIEERRRARGDGRPLNPSNTIAKVKATQLSMGRLQREGVQAEWHGRESALRRVLEALGWGTA